jgi:hypothetical protein
MMSNPCHAQGISLRPSHPLAARRAGRVFLTFDFQGGEDVKPDKNGILNYEMWSQGEYGPHHAIYRLLRILKEENVKATFLTCGAIAERFPEAVQAILDHGHVVEGHGYNHEIARYLPRDEEDR